MIKISGWISYRNYATLAIQIHKALLPSKFNFYAYASQKYARISDLWQSIEVTHLEKCVGGGLLPQRTSAECVRFILSKYLQRDPQATLRSLEVDDSRCRILSLISFFLSHWQPNILH